jgi:2-polyprenyl-6-methoxyphenol hydroxylase-like FAD-dependent oxidoreductase
MVSGREANDVGDRAVVLGAGIAGLLAAAVLADEFSSVVVVERDRLPDDPNPRRGVPQGRHLHSLLSRGSLALEELLPGILAELQTAGALVLEDANMARIYVRSGPHTFNRTDPVADPAALVTLLASRPFLEHQLRRRIQARANVTFLDNHDIDELIRATTGSITGVHVTDRASRQSATLGGELVVDATGRATRTPRLLEELGYGRPPQRSFTTDGIYHSQQLAIPDQDTFPEKMVLVLDQKAARRGGLIAYEHDTWALTIAGHAAGRATAPSDLADMLAAARSFVPPHILPALQTAHALGDVSTYRYPGGAWHRYDQMADHPNGLLVLGDAVCCLDPINGQGMTMAALGALALRGHLQKTSPTVPQQYYRELAAHIAPVWRMNRPPKRDVPMRRRWTLGQRLGRWTRRSILEAAPHDIVVTERLLRVTNLIDPPQRLLDPPLLARALTHRTRQSVARRLGK